MVAADAFPTPIVLHETKCLRPIDSTNSNAASSVRRDLDWTGFPPSRITASTIELSTITTTTNTTTIDSNNQFDGTRASIRIGYTKSSP
ncbi:hypothetical protein ECG_07422 [Echinococcus granulosus]|nr:hypothetical protein ECG_07422 [Echinococcus granulosus]